MEKSKARYINNRRFIFSLVLSIVLLIIGALAFYLRHDIKYNNVEMSVKRNNEFIVNGFSKDYYEIEVEKQQNLKKEELLFSVAIISSTFGVLLLLSSFILRKNVSEIINSSKDDIDMDKVDMEAVKKMDDKFEPVAERIGRMEVKTDKYKYAEIAKTIKEELKDSENKTSDK